VIVGNPPFLGGNKIRAELGDKYVNALFQLYNGRVPAFARFGLLLVRKSTRHD
jgi:hypothetical protein